MTISHYKLGGIVRAHLENQAIMDAAAEAEAMMKREQSPHLATEPGIASNRAERRRQAAQARKARP